MQQKQVKIAPGVGKSIYPLEKPEINEWFNYIHSEVRAAADGTTKVTSGQLHVTVHAITPDVLQAMIGMESTLLSALEHLKKQEGNQ